VTSNAVAIARASYDRCCTAPQFFDVFYEHFFAACPTAPPMFSKTDFKRQHRLLQHAIGLLLTFNHQATTEPNVLTRVADRHGRGDLAVDPGFYPGFLESLIQTAREFDPEFSPEVDQAWREATAPGLAYMRSKY
jgi:hemoglobin-like flavoprotein